MCDGRDRSLNDRPSLLEKTSFGHGKTNELLVIRSQHFWSIPREDPQQQWLMKKVEIPARSCSPSPLEPVEPLLAQLDRAPGFEPGGWGFEPLGAGHT